MSSAARWGRGWSGRRFDETTRDWAKSRCKGQICGSPANSVLSLRYVACRTRARSSPTPARLYIEPVYLAPSGAGGWRLVVQGRPLQVRLLRISDRDAVLTKSFTEAAMVEPASQGPYLQRGNDLTSEPGMWLSVPATNNPNGPVTVARMASIPLPPTVEAPRLGRGHRSPTWGQARSY